MDGIGAFDMASGEVEDSPLIADAGLELGGETIDLRALFVMC